MKILRYIVENCTIFIRKFARVFFLLQSNIVSLIDIYYWIVFQLLIILINSESTLDNLDEIKILIFYLREK